MSKRGTLVVVSGFSGAGKGTLMNKLVDEHDNYALSISATTRAPREGEVDGREYFFKTNEEFEKLIAEDALVEYAKYVCHYYGTPLEYVETMLKEGKNVILEIEIQGAHKIKEKFPETLMLFVVPPSIKELEQRLLMRGTDCEDVIRSRLERAVHEAQGMSGYDYILVNDNIEECANKMHQIIQGDNVSMEDNKELIERIQDELINHISQ